MYGQGAREIAFLTTHSKQWFIIGNIVKNLFEWRNVQYHRGWFLDMFSGGFKNNENEFREYGTNS